MTQSRRKFLGAAASLVVVSAWGGRSLAAQVQGQTAPPMSPLPFPSPADPIGGPMPTRTLSAGERMKLNQAEIKKNMARLKELVGELQKELDSHNATSVLSMTAVHQTEDIEKLARDIRGLLRG